MADTNGHPPDPLIDDLVQRPWAFDFFRAIRLLEARRPDLPRIGFSIAPAEDPVRFWQKPSFRFAPSPLDSVLPPGPSGVPRVAVNFFGLFGPNAPLPPHITEYVLERELHHHDPTITAFFNLFHHRLISMFYRAWAATQKTADLDRPDEQRYATYVGSLFGIGMDALQQQDAVADNAKLFFAGRLSCQTRNAEGLESILREYFHIPSEVQPFAGRWLPLPADSVCRLGQSPDSGRLGVNTIVGERFWESQLSFRMKFGPMSLADYERMLPKGESFERLKYWVLNYCGEHFFWDAQLVLRADEVPPSRLGQAGVRSFSVDDLTDIAALAGKVSDQALPGTLARHLWDQLAPDTRAKLSAGTTGQLPRAEQQAIVNDLNRVLQRGALYEAGRFTGINLSEETHELLARQAVGEDVAGLNRRLLEEAFPEEIARSRTGDGVPATRLGQTGAGALSADDLTDLPALAAKLSADAPPESLTRHLWDQLQPATREKLRTCTGDVPLPQKQEILDDLNHVLRRALLHDPKRFAGITLSAETEALLAKAASARDVATVNRRLLEDAFPAEISRHRRPGGLGWTTWLKTKSFSQDADQLILRPPQA